MNKVSSRSKHLLSKSRVLIVNTYPLMTSFFKDIGCTLSFIKNGEDISEEALSRIDVVVFTGGTDISYNIYSSERDFRTEDSDSVRDEYEVSLIRRLSSMGIGMVGIGRGGQLLSCLLGGSLVQYDQSQVHINPHSMTIHQTGEVIEDVSSSHSQIMMPHSSMKILAYLDSDTEACAHEDMGVLCVSFHPEWEDTNSKVITIFMDWMVEYCL